MRGTKLFTLIKALDSTEKECLISSVSAKLNKKSFKHIQLLCEHADDLLEGKICQEDLFTLFFPKESSYADKKLRDCLYQYHQLVKEFIIELQLKTKEDFQRDIYHSFLEERGLYKVFNRSLKEQEKRIEGKTLINSEERKLLFDIAKNRYLLNEKDYLKNRKELIEKALFQLDTYYFTEKLKWSLELLGGEMYLSHKYEVSLLNEVLTEVKQQKFKSNPFLTIYYLVSLFYKRNYSIENYQLLKSSILEIITLVSPQEKRSWVIDLFNYINTLYSNTGDSKLIHEIHEINKLGIRHGTYLKNGKFDNHNALNISNVALRLGKVDWVKEFLKKIENHIADVDALILIRAMISFELKEYDDVRIYLNEVVYKDIYFAMSAKSLLAMTYFLQKEYALLSSHLSALELFYRRNKTLSKSLIESNLNFVLTLRKIAKHVTTPSKLTNISTDIEGVNNMAYKAWVYSTLKELLT